MFPVPVYIQKKVPHPFPVHVPVPVERRVPVAVPVVHTRKVPVPVQVPGKNCHSFMQVDFVYFFHSLIPFDKYLLQFYIGLPSFFPISLLSLTVIFLLSCTRFVSVLSVTPFKQTFSFLLLLCLTTFSNAVLPSFSCSVISDTVFNMRPEYRVSVAVPHPVHIVQKVAVPVDRPYPVKTPVHIPYPVERRG